MNFFLYDLGDLSGHAKISLTIENAQQLVCGAHDMREENAFLAFGSHLGTRIMIEPPLLEIYLIGWLISQQCDKF